MCPGRLIIVAALLVSGLHPNQAKVRDSKGDEADEPSVGARLPGGGLCIREAFGRSDLVALVEVVEVGARVDVSKGKERFKITILILDSFGARAAREFPVDVARRIHPKSREECVPSVGRKYLVFLEQPDPEQVWLVKMIDATEENVRAIKDLIKSTGLPPT